MMISKKKVLYQLELQAGSRDPSHEIKGPRTPSAVGFERQHIRIHVHADASSHFITKSERGPSQANMGTAARPWLASASQCPPHLSPLRNLPPWWGLVFDSLP